LESDAGSSAAGFFSGLASERRSPSRATRCGQVWHVSGCRNRNPVFGGREVVNESKTSYLTILSSQVTCRRAMKRHIVGTLYLSSKDLAPIRAFPFSMRFERAVFQGQGSRCGISNFKI
jgi:hypothetical protein